MGSSENSSPRPALERAREALQQLEQSQATERKIGMLTRIAVSAVVVLAWAGLIVHTFFEDNAPKVDSTSVALLAVALIAPFVSRLKALEVGGAKAEWQEGAAASLTEIIRFLGMQQEAISQLFDEVAARAAADTQTSAPSAQARVELTDDKPRTLRRLLWVDDHPENNTYELESLRQLLDVITVTNNEDALKVLARLDIDAVISDVGRDDDDLDQPPGGVQFLHHLRQLPPDKQPPVLYYTSSRSIRRYGADLEADGALIVTSLFSDLLRKLRHLESQFLEATAREAASKRGNLRDPLSSDAPDVVVELPSGPVLGIEAASWLQRPQMAAFTDRANSLIAAVSRGEITQGILLVRPDVLDDRHRLWAAEREIEVAGPDELAQLLDEYATTPLPPGQTSPAAQDGPRVP